MDVELEYIALMQWRFLCLLARSALFFCPLRLDGWTMLQSEVRCGKSCHDYGWHVFTELH